MDSCKICGGTLEQFDSQSPVDLLYRAKCRRCGEYLITDLALCAEPEPFVKERLHLISAVSRWRSQKGNWLQIKEKLLDERSEFESKILSVCPRNVEEKMDGILRYIAEKSSYPGQIITIDMNCDYPLFYCEGYKELDFYLSHLERNLLLLRNHIGNDIMELVLEAEGWKRVEELAKPNIESKQAFVAMWFDEELKSAYSKGIAKLKEDTDFSMLRIDMREFNDKICDKILAEIRRSRFIIADVTGHRQGVYFEAGFAMGLGLPVIWTCREDEIDACHFDTRQYNHITWKDADELHQKLKDRILATIGKAG